MPMAMRLSDLTASQRSVLGALDDGYPYEDSVGVEIQMLSDLQVAEAGMLHRFGLIEGMHGRHRSVWLRLTRRGRKLRDTGSVD